MPSPLRLAILSAMLLLAACSTASNRRPDTCPRVALLADAADLTRYRSTGHDITDLLLQARISAVPATCASGGNGFVNTTLRITALVRRGPAAEANTVQVVPFISVLEGDTLLDQQDIPLTVAFPPNREIVPVTTNEIILHVPDTQAHPASTKRILIGLRLSPDELAANRKRGPLR